MPDGLDALFDGRSPRLSPSEVAEILGITTQVVYQWLRAGTIPAYKYGSTWIILRDDLKESIREGSNSPAKKADDAEGDDEKG